MSRQLPSSPPDVFRLMVSSTLPERAQALCTQLLAIGIARSVQLQILDLYFLEGTLTPQELDQLQTLVCDPVTDQCSVYPPGDDGVAALKPGEHLLEVAYRPGVTDNAARQLLAAAHRLGVTGLRAAATGRRYLFFGDLTPADLHCIARKLLVNETVERYALGVLPPPFSDDLPEEVPMPEIIPLRTADAEDLQALSAQRRLALDLREMQAVQTYFCTENRDPTDAELETIAQTWSEHCVHKTFKARILVEGADNGEQAGDAGRDMAMDRGGQSDLFVVDGIIRTYLQAATRQINASWVRSAFVDNAGVIAFDDQYDLSFKVETHNHPSALEPFGGANTGVGGVVRDILGVSHRPIVNTDVLCFGPQDMSLEALPEGVLHPRRMQSGVVAGVGDYGNKLGLPTVNGSVLYHEGYTANPLVYCGCVGLGRHGAHPRKVQPGDRIIVLGGRTGRDGLRGATFSSLTMDITTGQVSGSAVQIGDPITEKGLIEVVTRAAEDSLYHAITDCGAGGLSSAVGEMAESMGARVHLEAVLLKYAGLSPWEIWLSEAQERMVLAVPPENLPALRALCETYGIEVSDIGEFVPSGRLQVFYEETPVVDLDNAFLHTCPRRELRAAYPVRRRAMPAPVIAHFPASSADLLRALLTHPNIASKEHIIRVYDHEVRGATVVKPLVGRYGDGPSDAAVLKPLETRGWRGFVLSNGINPFLMEADPYAGAFSAVDEAIRNAIAVGADPARLALLDNFCWGDPLRPETLGTLVEAARACHQAALHYSAPFISGKDSLNNEYLGADGKRHAIPGTLLISAIAIHPDVRRAVTMDAKAPGDALYLVGDWQPALAGSHAALIAGVAFFENVPALNVAPLPSDHAPQVYRALHESIHRGLVRAAHDLSEGGLAVCAAEMALAGGLGLSLDLSPLHPDPYLAFFAESNGCLLVEVPLERCAGFESAFDGLPYHLLGHVTAKAELRLAHTGSSLLEVPVATLRGWWSVSNN